MLRLRGGRGALAFTLEAGTVVTFTFDAVQRFDFLDSYVGDLPSVLHLDKIRDAGVRIGATHLFVKPLLRPEPTAMRLALWAAHRETPDCPPPPPAGRVTLEVDPTAPQGFYEVAGFWPIGPQAIRIDIVERVARAMHGAREGAAPFTPDDHWIAQVGATRDGFARLMRALGYRLRSVDGKAGFEWKGVRSDRPRASATDEGRSPFAVLKAMRRR